MYDRASRESFTHRFYKTGAGSDAYGSDNDMND